MRSKPIIQTVKAPLILLTALIFFVIVYQLLNLPNTAELVLIVRDYFTRYGYPVLFISAFIEAIPGINLYFPGSTIILLAAAFSRQGTMNIFTVVLLTSLAFILAYILNYYLGRQGWHRIFLRFGLEETLRKTRDQVEKKGNWWIWLSYVHPNLGALTATAFGVLKLPFRQFLLHSIIAVLVWDMFWGTAAYLSSNKIIEIITIRWVIIVLLILWILLQVAKEARKSSK